MTLLHTWWVAALASAASTGLAASLTAGPTVEFTNGSQPVISWRTDVSTGSRVFFGESPARMRRRGEGKQGVNHSVLLPALEPGTQWSYAVGTARVALATNWFIVPGKLIRDPAPQKIGEGNSSTRKANLVSDAPPTRETWGNLASLPDHFERHGRDFNARNADDYARLAWEFRQRAKAEGLPTKIDSVGVTRVYDPKTGAFGAYNRNGTTKTFFKPKSRDYFNRQPGELVRPKERN